MHLFRPSTALQASAIFVFRQIPTFNDYQPSTTSNLQRLATFNDYQPSTNIFTIKMEPVSQPASSVELTSAITPCKSLLDEILILITQLGRTLHNISSQVNVLGEVIRNIVFSAACAIEDMYPIDSDKLSLLRNKHFYEMTRKTAQIMHVVSRQKAASAGTSRASFTVDYTINFAERNLWFQMNVAREVLLAFEHIGKLCQKHKTSLSRI
jgi:hypothetical protein